jgi:hypothetical protein
MSVELIIAIAAIIIIWLLFTWLIKVFKASIKTVLIIGAIIVLLQVFLGIQSQEIVQEVIRIIQNIEQLILKFFK